MEQISFRDGSYQYVVHPGQLEAAGKSLPSGSRSITCAKCGHQPVEILRMTVVYETTVDLKTRESAHRHASTTYSIRCPDCGRQARVEIPAGE